MSLSPPQPSNYSSSGGTIQGQMNLVNENIKHLIQTTDYQLFTEL